MGLSSDLISQFVKVTNDTKATKKDVVLYGEIKKYNGGTYVQLDGSDLLTPYESATEVEEGDRVSVTVKNHTLTATGNMSSPAARTGTVQSISERVDTISATTIDTEYLNATFATIENLNATNGKIETLESNQITTDTLNATYATIENLNATNGNVDDLTAKTAAIDNLETNYANIKFANVDFAKIEKAVFSEFYANSGIIKDVVVNDQQITGTLVGVTITGDLIEGNTVVAEKLVIRGEDGLYYKLNTDGMTTSAEQTDYNSINGTIIKAKSVTAEKIAVSDLVAFDATIGGFHITDNSIYSGVKTSIDNPLGGLYLDNDGQMYLGDHDNYLRYYKDENGNYKLEISAESLMFGVQKQTIENILDENADLKKKLDQYEKHFTFNENGISILDSCGENTAELRLDTGIISFVKNGEQYGYWDGVDFHTGNVIIDVNERAQFGDFAFIPRSDGSLSFLKVAGASSSSGSTYISANVVDDTLEVENSKVVNGTLYLGTETGTTPTPSVNNIFTTDMIEPETNVASMNAINSNSVSVTVSSADESALYMPLDPSKTYRLRYTGNNVSFSAFDEDWNDAGSCNINNCDITMVGPKYCYFYVTSFDDSNVYTINNIILEEVG